MKKRFVLSPEIAELFTSLDALEKITFNCGESDPKIEALLQQIANHLPKKYLGFKHHGRAFLKQEVLDSLPDSEDFIFPKEQPKELKE